MARIILAALAEGKREVVIAQGGELGAATLRTADPERLWAGLAREGARLAEARDASGGRFRPEPARVER